MSGRRPSLSQREVIAALAGAGFRRVPGRGKGGHAFLHREDPPTGLTDPSGTVKRGTLRAIIR